MAKIVGRSGNEVTVEVSVRLERQPAGDGRGDPSGHQRGWLLRERGGTEALRHRRQPDPGRGDQADRARARSEGVPDALRRGAGRALRLPDLARRAHLLSARAPGTDHPRRHAAVRQPAQPQVCAAQRARGADGLGAEPRPQGRPPPTFRTLPTGWAPSPRPRKRPGSTRCRGSTRPSPPSWSVSTGP